ncbi:Beta-glucuronidase [Flammeovirgaceae bacterium 311]|nr:Beta-glucuronidase [Flammeovirgaceae bacterium 311]
MQPSLEAQQTNAPATQQAQQAPLLINAFNRSTQSLNGSWQIIVDPFDNGYLNYRLQPFDEMDSPNNNAYYRNYKTDDKSQLVEYDFDESETLEVPSDWNSQNEKLFYYEGSVWYKKSFDFSKKNPANKVFLHFGAVNYKADVYLNGEKLGVHKGGFTPFDYDITDRLKEADNFVILRVNNQRRPEEVPTINTDWWNYGGITRDVSLIEVPPTYISDYKLQLDPKNNTQLLGYIQLSGTAQAGKKVTLNIPELKVKQEFTTDGNGRSAVNIKLRRVQYWSPERPKLYNMQLSTGEETVEERIGLRTLTVAGPEILLNGQPVFLRGISIHEENPLKGGRAHSEEDARLLLGWAKELGCNFVRLAHYPHNEHMPRLADEMGLMVWEENPVYWTIHWENPETYRNAENQLTELITRDKNRASVVIWSMANETPTSEPRLQFLSRLAARARELDGTRLISAALEQEVGEGDPNSRTINDPFAEHVDVLSFNQYIGWYEGMPDKTQQIKWVIEQNKPVIISEFGAGAKQGLHGERTERFTEEFQEDLYRQTLAMLEKIPQLRGIAPWILVDFRSPRRALPGIQDGWNRKGLIGSNGEKKKAFSVLRQYYDQKKENFARTGQK